MAKYSFEFKKEIVVAYLSGKGASCIIKNVDVEN